jgi:hypothetical protein
LRLFGPRKIQSILVASAALVGTCGFSFTKVKNAQAPKPGPHSAKISLAAQRDDNDSDRLQNFALRYNDVVDPLRFMSALVLPGHDLQIEVLGSTQVKASAHDGKIQQTVDHAFTYTAPLSLGAHPIEFVDSATGEQATLQVIVLQPFDHRSVSLNGFRFGSYQKKSMRGLATYELPEGFIEVRPENMKLKLSPHFALNQFLVKQPGGFPKYVLVRERLLLKLEQALEAVHDAGIHVSSFHLMSGFRTPWYNANIGNETIYSRHVYGDAADIWVDADGDGAMDDLNHDGRLTKDDAKALTEIIAKRKPRKWDRQYIGGQGLYNPTHAHGPFVHLDARGFKARW